LENGKGDSVGQHELLATSVTDCATASSWRPGSTCNSLTDNGDGTFTDTQPDGFEIVYASGAVCRYRNLVGNRWRVLYNGPAGAVSAINDPFNRRVTFFDYPRQPQPNEGKRTVIPSSASS
jgi:hypothetical protein